MKRSEVQKRHATLLGKFNRWIGKRTGLKNMERERQQELDKQKQEDMLVEKLLQREEEEMKQAYLDARIRKCKATQVENRRLRAEATG